MPSDCRERRRLVDVVNGQGSDKRFVHVNCQADRRQKPEQHALEFSPGVISKKIILHGTSGNRGNG